MNETGSYANADAEIKQWLLRVSEGDEDVFSRLLRYFWNKVYTQALVYLKSSVGAQELTQDVFLKIWTNRSRLTEVKNFSAYLFILVRNEVVSQLRKKQSPLAEPDERLEEELWIPDQQLQYKQSYAILLRGIDLLPPARKEVFRMSRLENLSYDEIAAKLNISRNGVKDHIVKALVFLRNHIRLHSDTRL